MNIDDLEMETRLNSILQTNFKNSFKRQHPAVKLMVATTSCDIP